MAFDALGLDVTALAVYQAMLQYPRWGVSALGRHLQLPEDQVRDALDQLADMALLRSSRDNPEEFCAVSPNAGLAALLARQEAELASRQHQLAADHAALARMVAEYVAQPAGPEDPLIGLDAVQARLEHLAATAEDSCLSIMPGGAQSQQSLAASRPLDEAAIQRGVTVRTLYQDSIRNDAATLAYAQWLTTLGGQVRTSPLLPPRMLIIDTAVAIVPLDPAHTRKGAVHVTAPGIIAALIALFEQTWQHSVDFAFAPSVNSDETLTSIENALIRLLAEGFTDQAAAKRLGISLRTERRIVADLMNRLAASSRFAAGALAAKQGWI
jgi:sugar-specific transcriptional regulator TrmB/DNA-binding CsgD family transcriptional regulator